MDEAQRKSIAAGNCGRRSKPGGHLQVNWRGGLWFRTATAVGAAGGAQQRFSGSTAWTAAPRVGFMVAEDPLTKQRFMLPVKNNIGDDRLGYQYHIAEKLIQYGGQTFKSSYIVWDQTTNRSVAQLLTPPKANKSDAVGLAKDFLGDELANAPLPVDQIQAAAKAAGISWPSVLRAKSTMLITSEKVGSGWRWTLLTAKGEGNV